MSDDTRDLIAQARVNDVRHLLMYSGFSDETMRLLFAKSVQRRVLTNLEHRAEPTGDEQQAVAILRRLLNTSDDPSTLPATPREP